MVDRQTILIFDSGLGGLTVYREVAAARPDADFLYVADDAAFPYGAIAEPALIARVAGLMGELIAAHRPDLIVIACNTASTIVLAELRRKFAVPFVGTVPAIKPACAALGDTARLRPWHRGDGAARIYPCAHSRLCGRLPSHAGGLEEAGGLCRRRPCRRAGRRRRVAERNRALPSSMTASAPTPSCSPAPTIHC